VLTVIDSFTRECLALTVAKSLPSPSITETPNRVIQHRGIPPTIQMDNGTEFTSNHFDVWAYLRGTDVDFIRPGNPVDNAHIESFNDRLRDRRLNSKWSECLDDARKALQAWRRDDNELRPHSSLGDMPPSAFAARIQGLHPDPCSRA
jgi:putative transposase